MKQGDLHISNLRFRYPGATEDLFQLAQFSVMQGQTIGVRGASGAGKTTLLHCLAGIEHATAGNIQWGKDDLGQLSSAQITYWRQTSLGLVFQDFYLVEGLSAIDNVLLPVRFAAWRCTPAQRERAAHLLNRVGIKTPERRAELLSRGERQRVAVARALLFEPSVVLADEPTASLDPENRELIGNLLLELVREHQATLIVVSHDLDLLARLDQSFELRAGQLQSIQTHNE